MWAYLRRDNEKYNHHDSNLVFIGISPCWQTIWLVTIWKWWLVIKIKLVQHELIILQLRVIHCLHCRYPGMILRSPALGQTKLAWERFLDKHFETKKSKGKREPYWECPPPRPAFCMLWAGSAGSNGFLLSISGDTAWENPQFGIVWVLTRWTIL